MRTQSFALLALCLAAIATAATPPIVGPEIAVAPIAYGQPALVAGPSTAVVRDGDGFVIAWSAGDVAASHARTFVARLDSSGGAVFGSVRELPTTQPYYDAVLPSIVAAPNGFLIGQTEVAELSRRNVVWRLDRTLNPESLPFVVVPTKLAGFVRIIDGRVFAVSDSAIVELDLDGMLLRTAAAQFAADDVAIAADAVVLGGHASQPLTQMCGFGWCSPAVPAHYDLFVAVDGRLPTQRLTFPFYSTNGVGVASDGTTVVSVFFDGGIVKFLRHAVGGFAIDPVPRQLGDFESDANAPPQRPSVAFDGVRYLVVWQTSVSGGHAIRAAAIDRDGAVTPIAVPHLADETLPSVTAVGTNRFFVSYQSRREGQTSVAGRFIAFGGRRPAAGR
jgi:hypothetical protein